MLNKLIMTVHANSGNTVRTGEGRGKKKKVNGFIVNSVNKTNALMGFSGANKKKGLRAKVSTGLGGSFKGNVTAAKNNRTADLKAAEQAKAQAKKDAKNQKARDKRAATRAAEGTRTNVTTPKKTAPRQQLKAPKNGSIQSFQKGLKRATKGTRTTPQ